jgi:protocatechuate 3,4-dioxygenase beta subunit
MEKRITRRGSLAALGGLAAGAFGWSAGDAGAGPAGVASGAVSCVLTPELTEGPYYLPNEAVRRNITEGRPGTPLRLRLSVVNASTCGPIGSAAVDIWHADALGVYSGVQGNSGTFMRGIQRTDASGLALFDTVYPGWYQGRTVHIHVKVHLGGRVVHTGQLFFSDSLTDKVYAASPYDKRGPRDTRNATDAIYRNGGRRSTLTLAKSGSRYVGSITMGVLG